MVKDLTQGKAGRVLIGFALPMFIGNLFQQLYNLADFVIVGQVVGEKGLAAIGASFAVFFLMIAVGTGLSIGISVVIAQYFGAKKTDEVHISIRTSLIIAAIVGIIFTGFGILIAKPMLLLLKTPSSFIDMSLEYLVVIFAGSLFMMVYNGITAVFNALGDSKTPLYVLVGTSIVNIGLDLLFVKTFNLGVSGAAWATNISQLISAVILGALLIRKVRIIPQTQKLPIFNKEIAIKISKIAVPSILQQSIVSLGMMFSQNIINMCGDNFVAGTTAAFRIDSLATMPFINISTAMSSFTGQNIGAGHADRVKKGYKAGLLTCLGIASFATLVMYLFGKQMLMAFLDAGTSAQALSFGEQMLRIISPFYILGGVMFLTNGLLRGVGDMKFFTLSTLLGLAARIGSMYLMYYFILPEGARHLSVSVAIPIGWAVSVAMVVSRFLSNKWLKKAK